MKTNLKSSVSKIDKNGIKRLITIFSTLVVQGLIMFLFAGNFNINRIWLFLIINLIYIVTSILLLLILFPDKIDLVNQRGKFKSDSKKWDKILISILALFSLILTPATFGLDLGRLHWSDIPISYFYYLIILYLFAQVFGQWAMISNPHFETTVRLQDDRNHKVASSGPYQLVRHPGYVSFIISTIITPFMLGSWLSLIPASVIVILFLVRTWLEDKTLLKELQGYKDYAKEVKYRLIPYIW